MNRKGLAASTLVSIIIVLIAFMTIAWVIYGFTSKAETKEAEIVCQNSIALRASSAIQVNGADIALSPVLCKTQDYKLTGNREEIKEQLAYLMARCWWMFGEGRYEEILSDPDISRKVLGISKGQNDCFVCSTALIDEKDIKGGSIGAQEMWNYMIEKDHRQIKGLSYLNYIQGYGGPGKVAIMNEIDPQSAQSIIFMAKNKEDDSGSWWTPILITLAGAGVVACAILEPCGLIAGGVVGGTAATVTTTTVAATAATVTTTTVVATAATAATLSTTALVAGGGIAAAGGSWTGWKAYNEFAEHERSVSIVTLAHVNAVKHMGCAVGDLGGE